ncbi:hypothetical protein LINPERHAP1_LOCUS37011 [Linum perenne]
MSKPWSRRILMTFCKFLSL